MRYKLRFSCLSPSRGWGRDLINGMKHPWDPVTCMVSNFNNLSTRGSNERMRKHCGSPPAVGTHRYNYIFKMPYLSRRLLVSLCPFVNLDLFKQGYYHIRCRMEDNDTRSKAICSEVMDPLGALLSDYTYPGACLVDDAFLTQTMQVEYTKQSFMLGESFVFISELPFFNNYTEAYIPSRLTLRLDLMFSGMEDMPESPSTFQCVSSRALTINVDWHKGHHEHFPVVFDYFHMASLGVTMHASLYELCLEPFVFPTPVTPQKSWYTSQAPPPELPSLVTLLFGNAAPPSTRQSPYLVPTEQLQRGQDALQLLSDILHYACDNLYMNQVVMTGGDHTHSSSDCNACDEMSAVTSLEEAEAFCMTKIKSLNSALKEAWNLFCKNALTNPEIFLFLAKKSHSAKLSYMATTFVTPNTPNCMQASNDSIDIGDPSYQEKAASKIRKSIQIPFSAYCQENLETESQCSVLFMEPCPWPTTNSVSPFETVSDNSATPKAACTTQPYMTDVLPHSQHQRLPGTHLVVCVHGLQGNQYDLRLYQVYLQLALPQVKFEFMLAQSNQADTFSDFNLLTDRLLSEVLDYIKEMSSAPEKISFIGQSLGNIIIRNVITRPEFTHLHPKLHAFLSICGPHLGTRFQQGLISTGMWFMRKWYNSTSLLQLCLKDTQNPRDSFLYQLSEAATFEHFRHVILLSSHQDKYVPYQSAKIGPVVRDGSLQNELGFEMAQNILQPMQEAKVNVVRVSVNFAMPTSANSFLGRAAHIAMLDAELFIEKFVLLHFAQYFL